MEFEIVFYKNAKGGNPIEKFLIDLAIDNRVLVARTRKGIEQLRNSAYHKAPLSKHLESGWR